MIYIAIFLSYKQQLEKLGREIEELKYENRNLSQNVMDLMPDENNEDPRIHQYNNKGWSTHITLHLLIEFFRLKLYLKIMMRKQ